VFAGGFSRELERKFNRTNRLKYVVHVKFYNVTLDDAVENFAALFAVARLLRRNPTRWRYESFACDVFLLAAYLRPEQLRVKRVFIVCSTSTFCRGRSLSYISGRPRQQRKIQMVQRLRLDHLRGLCQHLLPVPGVKKKNLMLSKLPRVGNTISTVRDYKIYFGFLFYLVLSKVTQK